MLQKSLPAPRDAGNAGTHAVDIKNVSVSELAELEIARTDGFKRAGIGTALASAKGVANHLITAAGVLLGVLILGSLGAFFLYVPILPVAAAVTIMLALILMFVLGVQTGGRRIRVLRRKNAAGSRVAE